MVPAFILIQKTWFSRQKYLKSPRQYPDIFFKGPENGFPVMLNEFLRKTPSCDGKAGFSFSFISSCRSLQILAVSTPIIVNFLPHLQQLFSIFLVDLISC